MDSAKLFDVQSSLINLRKEIDLIKKNLFKCYLKPEEVLVPKTAALDYFAAFLTPKSISSTLKYDRNKMTHLSKVLEVIEEGFNTIEKTDRFYTRYIQRKCL